MDWKRYWHIILYRSYAELKSEAQLNYMGYVWWLLEPLLNTVLFYIILVFFLEQSTVDAVSMGLVGAIVWQWFNSSLDGAAGSIFEAGGMLKLIYLPKVILPVISIVISSWKFIFIFGLLLLWVWGTGHGINATYAALPLLLLLELGVILAISLPLSAIMPYFPDARIAVGALLRSVMLLSGIFFPIEKVPAAYRGIFYLNPMAVLITAFRDVLLFARWPRWDQLGYVTIFCMVMLTGTAWFFARVDRSLVKAIHR